MKKYIAQDKLTKAYAMEGQCELTCFKMFARKFETKEKAYKYMSRYFALSRQWVEIIEVE